MTGDGTEILIASGYVKGSARGCEEWGMTMLASAVYDQFERCAGLGQGCACGRAKCWTGCSHPATATLVFLAVGSKIRTTSARCGTDPEELLKGEWNWLSVLKHIKGRSSESPSLQIRRSMFDLKANKTLKAEGTEAQTPSPSSASVSEPVGAPPAIAIGPEAAVAEVPGAPVPGGDLYDVPGFPSMRLRVLMVTSIANPVEVAAAVVPTVTAALYETVARLSPSQLKSLLQKLVRWGEGVVCVDEDADAVLVCAFVALMVGPGQFLPELGQHSKGPRLALQRTVITLVEDGISPGDVGDELAYYAALAGVTQESGGLPAPSVIQAAARMLVRGRHSDSVLDWRGLKRKRPLVAENAPARNTEELFTGLGGSVNVIFTYMSGLTVRATVLPSTSLEEVRTPLLLAGGAKGLPSPTVGLLNEAGEKFGYSWQLPFAALEPSPTAPKYAVVIGEHGFAFARCIREVFAKIGAMKGDLSMMSAVVNAQAVASAAVPNPPVRVALERLLSMHLDLHSEPGMPHVNSDWFCSTGANFRNGRPVDAAKLNSLEEAQRCALAHTARQPRPQVPVVGQTLIPLGADLEELAAYCAGQTNVQVGNRTYLAVFAAHDIQTVVIMEKPTRSQDDISYIAAESKLYREAMHELRKKKVSLGRPLDGYFLRFDHDGRGWSVQRRRHRAHAEAQDGKASVQLHPAARREETRLGLLTCGQGIRRGGVELVVAALRRLSPADRTEVVRTLSVVDPAGEVHMAPIVRSVRPEGMRHNVYSFLAEIAFQCPGALRAARAAVFAVPDALIFNHVRGLLFDAAVEHDSDKGQWLGARALGVLPGLKQSVVDHITDFLAAGCCSSGARVQATPHGDLRESQQRCAEAMAQRGRRSFVLAPTGSGKTAVAVNRLCAVADHVEYAFFFIDTLSGASAVAFEIEWRCKVQIVFLDPRKSKGAGAREMIDGKIKGRTFNAEAAPVRGALNIVLYDHFAGYDDFRARIVAAAPSSFAVMDECDKLYADTKRSLFAVPYARLFRYLVMMSATALRRQSEHVGPRAAIASLFSPIPVDANNLLVFFAGSVQTFKHEMLYEKEERAIRFSLPNGLLHVGERTFHSLSEATFEASIEQLMIAARLRPPSILVTESVSQVQRILDAYPEETQGFPVHEGEALSKQVVVISKYQGRSTNFGRVCNSMVCCPLASSVATRRQVTGRLTRGPLRKLYYTTVVLEGSVHDFLLQSQHASNVVQAKLENLVQLANELEERKKRAVREPALVLPVAGAMDA